jgi:hypothetical protein
MECSKMLPQALLWSRWQQPEKCTKGGSLAHSPTRGTRQCRRLRGHRILTGGRDRPRQRPRRSLDCTVRTTDRRRRFCSLR